MRRKLSAVFFLLLLAGTISAQQDAAGQELTLPSSPAFSVLNFEPTAILRPTSNKDLAADVLNAFDKDGKLLMNLGLEVAPYWLQSRPTLTREAYLNPDVWQTIRQSFSLSAATVRDSASGNNRLGTGFRLKLLNGHPVDSLKTAEAALNRQSQITSVYAEARALVAAGALTSVQAVSDEIVSQLKAASIAPATVHAIRMHADSVGNNYDSSRAELLLFVEKLIDDNEISKRALAEQVSTLTYLRKGLIAEFAGASAFNASGGDRLERMGVWANLSNYVSATDLLTLTARYLWRQQDTAISDFDIGLAYLKQGDRYNLSAEALVRWYAAELPDINQQGQPIRRVEKDFTYRLAVQGSYLVTRDISINLSFGKTFSQPFVTSSGFFSIFGLNYSLFSQQRVTL